MKFPLWTIIPAVFVFIIGIFCVSIIYSQAQEISYKFGEIEIKKSQLEQIMPKQDGQAFSLCDIDESKCIGLRLWELEK